MGVSRSISGYSPGSEVMSTCLRVLTYSINDAYNRGFVDKGAAGTYTNLYNIGAGVVPALGNTKAPTFTWAGPADVNDPSSLAAQSFSWNPYTVANTGALTSWGYIKLFALQAWNEFNFNSTQPQYRDFLSSYMQASSFVDYSNQAITSIDNGKSFLSTGYSNMDDLISADVTGVSTSTSLFGQDLLHTGKIIDTSKLASFGLPSTLLQSLQQTNSFTASVTLAMLAVGLTSAEISSISSGSSATAAQQTKIYQGMTLITGQDLRDVLIPLNCTTLGITVLTDLLDVRKLFPLSYSSLTVPVYSVSSTPSNSKVYYKIFQGTSNTINSQLSLPSIKAQIGTQTLSGIPDTTDQTNNTIQVPPTGFGSYLQGTGVPADVAIAAGAFSASMLQIRNIRSAPIEKFAQIVTNLETTLGLAVNGTTLPANQPLINSALPLIALGSGPVGTYTMSNFFGCMSGLPYAWRNIQGLINSAENPNLYRCYDEQYLAVTWEGALGHVTLALRERVIVPWSQGYNPQEAVPGVPADGPPWTTPPVPYVAGIPETPGQYEYDWHITGIVLDNAGGGYGRGTQSAKWAYQPHALAPLVFISGGSGATAHTTIQINPNPGGTNNYVPGPFGRVTSLILDNSGTWVHYASTTTTAPYVARFDPPGPTPPHPIPPVNNPPNPPLVYIECPPIGNGGVNSPAGTSGWPGMNTVIQGYTNQANPEIVAIRAAKQSTTDELNLLWNSTGTQLTLEQRARTVGYRPVPTPRSNDLSLFPTTTYAFVDSIPGYAKQIKPHMQSQTLEAISDMSTPGGQSMPGAMRETRNADRLIKAGITLDNNIESDLLPVETATLVGNGSLPTAVIGSGIVRNGQEMTVPAYLEQMVQVPIFTSTPTLGQIVASILATSSSPATVTVPSTTPFVQTIPVVATPLTITGLPQPVYADTSNIDTSVATVTLPLYIDPALTIPVETIAAVPPVNPTDNVPDVIIAPGTPMNVVVVTPNGVYDPITETYIIDSTPVPNGAATEPGSFAGNPYTRLIPPILDANLGSNVLLPSVPSIQEAIDQIIMCNCDSWAIAQQAELIHTEKVCRRPYVIF